LTNVNNNTGQFQINRRQVVLAAGATGRMPNIRWALHTALRFTVLLLLQWFMECQNKWKLIGNRHVGNGKANEDGHAIRNMRAGPSKWAD